MENKKYKLAFLASHVIQYQDPLFQELSKHPNIDLTVIFCSKKGAREYKDYEFGVRFKWNSGLLNGYYHKFLRNYSPFASGNDFFSCINPGIVNELQRGKYNAVIIMTGWGCFTAWLGFIACCIFQIPFFLYGDSSFIDGRNTLKKSSISNFPGQR